LAKNTLRIYRADHRPTKEVILLKNRTLLCRTISLAAAAALALALPASALLLTRAEAAPAVAAFSKNGPANDPIAFEQADFRVEDGTDALDAIIISALPDSAAGVLTLGGQSVTAGDQVSMHAVDGLRFVPAGGAAQAAFTFTPVFSSGLQGEQVTVGLYLLSEENSAPVAENLELTTYKNVAVTAQFSAVDPEGDLLSFHLLERPARGSVTLCENGEFVYTPYENKTGKDSFTYVAVDAVGNTSAPATVKLRIEKADTKVTYADMADHPAHKAAIRLAEAGVYTGQKVGDEYFFCPEAAVTRGEFVAMALSAMGVETLEDVTRTGFADDGEIPAWAKPYASAALKAGLVLGSTDGSGRAVFNAGSPITRGEAAVLLDRAIQVTDVSAALYEDTAPAWACQSAANLATCGVLRADASGALQLEDTMTRAEASQLLCAALDLLDSRSTGWFPW